jgi:AcrR family transcriptional regulator
MARPRARLEPSAVTSAFAPDGLHGTTSERIASCAGVAKPTVYAHGGSKEALFVTCVEGEVERLLTQISRADLATRSLPARARLTSLALAIIDHGHTHPAAARLLHATARHTASRVAGEVDAALARLPARVATILRRDTTPDCADRVAVALLGAAAALALAREGERDPERARDGANEQERDAELLGAAFAGALEPLADRDGTVAVQSVGVY